MKEIMSSPVIVGKLNNSIYEIAHIMQQYDIGFLPIANGNKIVGVITDRDLVTQALANKDINTSIENYITHNVISVESSGKVEDVLNIMAEYQIKRVLVTKENKVVGVIAFSDLLHSKIESQTLVETLSKIDRISTHSNQSSLEINSFYL